jgi:hypothetical protein
MSRVFDREHDAERTRQARAEGYLDDLEIRAGYDEARHAIEFGAMVRELRLGAGLFQEELA